MYAAGKNVAQLGALVVGVVYLLLGLVGFIPTGFTGFFEDGGDSLLGLDLNGFHNIVHLGIGLGLLGVSQASNPAVAEGTLIAGGLVLTLVAFLGFVGALQILSINSPAAPVNFFHILSAVGALLLGAIGTLQTRARVQDVPPDSFTAQRGLHHP